MNPVTAQAAPEPRSAPAAPVEESRESASAQQYERHAWFDLNGDGKIDNVSYLDGGDAYMIGDGNGDAKVVVTPGQQVRHEVPAPRTFKLPEHQDPTPRQSEPAPADPSGSAHVKMAKAIAEYQKF